MADIGDQERLAIESACTRLAIDYSYYADTQQLEAWSKLFAEDAEMTLFGQTHKGRAAILASLNGGNGGAIASFHSNSNIRIDVVSATEAKGSVGVTLFAAPRKDGVAVVKEITPAVVGHYVDEYRKTAEGWRIAKRGFNMLISRAQA
ncbi:MAG TPA: nuclear transport factor 2 family protein [Rhizomicrobium sp.]|nr:nuclear transport factor 2 family protein [Rhizomicrobium sp.]